MIQTEYNKSKVNLFLVLGATIALLACLLLGNIDMMLEFYSALFVGLLLFLVAGVFWIGAMVGEREIRLKRKVPKYESPKIIVGEKQEEKPEKSNDLEKMIHKMTDEILSKRQTFEKKFVGSRKLNRYHRNKYHVENCRLAKLIKPENRIYFENEEKAEKFGYVKCKKCFKDNSV